MEYWFAKIIVGVFILLMIGATRMPGGGLRIESKGVDRARNKLSVIGFVVVIVVVAIILLSMIKG